MTSLLRDRKLALQGNLVDHWYGDLLVLLDDNSDNDNDPGTRKKIGTIEIIKIDRRLDPQDYACAFDGMSATLTAFAGLFDAETGMMLPGVRNHVGNLWSGRGTILCVRDIQLDPQFRGLGLGLYMVDEACRKIDSSDTLGLVMALDPRLRAYFGLLGFQPLGDAFLARWSGYVMPSVTQVCPHLN